MVSVQPFFEPPVHAPEKSHPPTELVMLAHCNEKYDSNKSAVHWSKYLTGY